MRIYPVVLLLGLLLTACASGGAPSSRPHDRKSLELLLQEAEQAHAREDYVNALKSSKEAITANPGNQRAHYMAGVALVKLGAGKEARQQIKSALELDPTSEDGKRAASWLDRLTNKLPVAIFPFSIDNGVKSREAQLYVDGQLTRNSLEPGKNINVNVNQYVYEQYIKYLDASELYRIISSKDLGYYNSSSISANDQCAKSREKGAKIIIRGSINEFSQTKSLTNDKRLILLAPIIGTNLFFDGKMSVTIEVYATKECQLLRSMTKTATANKIALNQIIKVMTEDIINSMWPEIHGLLM